MDRTLNRGYPYPECEPPRVKDSSDIIDLRNLAYAVDADAEALESRLFDLLEEPDSARLSYSGSITFTGAGPNFLATVPYNSVTFDNKGNLTDTASNALIVRERGWYLVTTAARITDAAVDVQLMCRHLRNGRSFEEGRRLEGPSVAAVTNQEAMTCADVLLCQEGDVLQSQVRVLSFPGTLTFGSQLTMVQMLKLDV